MKYMPKDMIKDLKSDIKNGKIWGLKLVKTTTEVIQNNCYAQLYLEPREIVSFDDNCFYLKTRINQPHYLSGTYNPVDYYSPDYSIPDDIYTNAEAYYNAFSYYDGHYLKSIQEIPNAVNANDQIQITEYEVIRSY